MARLIHYTPHPTLPFLGGRIDLRRRLLQAAQLAVVGAIAMLIALAIVNTVLGVPQPEPTYSPYR